MNRLFLDRPLCQLFVLTALLVAGCYGEYRSDAPVAIPSDPEPLPPVYAAGSSMAALDTVWLDLTASEVAWQGTKMWARGRHTGTVPLKDGYLLFRDDRLVGGAVTVDMTSIRITDIPPDQPEPIAILTEHLGDPVFFDVERYPEAQFVITTVASGGPDARRNGDRGETMDAATPIRNVAASLTVGGNLTVKGVTRHISVPVDAVPTSSNGSTGKRYHTRFRINRFAWDVAYDGGFGASRFAARNFVDKHIELAITLALREDH